MSCADQEGRSQRGSCYSQLITPCYAPPSTPPSSTRSQPTGQHQPGASSDSNWLQFLLTRAIIRYHLAHGVTEPQALLAAILNRETINEPIDGDASQQPLGNEPQQQPTNQPLREGSQSGGDGRGIRRCGPRLNVRWAYDLQTSRSDELSGIHCIFA